MSPASINRLCVTGDPVEASRRPIFAQEGRPGQRQFTVIISSSPQNQNNDKEKTHSSSNNKQCNGDWSEFTRLACLSEEGLHAVTRSRAALRTERISGTLDRIYIRTRAVVVFRTQVTVLLTPADLIETTAANLAHALIGRLVHSWAAECTFFGSGLQSL